MKSGQFRSDLFYRLNVFPVRIPPLRERPDDIPLLVRHFTQQFARRMNRKIESIPSETMSVLCEYHWPGNIRELQNVIERAVILSPGSGVAGGALGSRLERLRASSRRRRRGPRPREACNAFLRKPNASRYSTALEERVWVVAGPKGAAARLGMKRSTLQLRMQKLGISPSNKPASNPQ